MNISKKHLIIIAILAVAFFGAWGIKVFPDGEENLSFIEWVKRQISAKMNGEN